MEVQAGSVHLNQLLYSILKSLYNFVKSDYTEDFLGCSEKINLYLTSKQMTA